jgi:hypothetical protein
MKKFIAICCTVLLLCAFPITAFAEGDSVAVDEPIADEVVTTPTAEETPTEGEISANTAIEETSAEKIVSYIKAHFEEISVVVSIIFMIFYEVRKHKLLNRSVGTLNNNAVDVARNSDASIQKALADMNGMVDVVAAYRNDFLAMLEEVRENADEKRKIEEALDETLSFINAAKLANVELGNEVAELLVLANIPNAKKSELYARHVAAVGAITEAEHTEVNTHDHGKEA